MFGLVYLRVPTWCPFRLQFYCNGHNWLARQLAAEGIGHTMVDNAFTRIDDWQRPSLACSVAQQLADNLSPDALHATWTVTPTCAARWPRCSGSPTTGA